MENKNDILFLRLTQGFRLIIIKESNKYSMKTKTHNGSWIVWSVVHGNLQSKTDLETALSLHYQVSFLF